MHSVTFVEPTTALRDWLRTVATVTAIASTRGYAGGLPKGATLPAYTLTRVGGGLDGPVDVGTWRFDCWAATQPAADQLAAVLISHLASQGPQNIGTAGVRFRGASITSLLPVPDPDNPDLYRTTFTAQVVTTTAPA